ncbi:hypothetical protein ACLX1H_002362 [Fusarium chlamydosporum]
MEPIALIEPSSPAPEHPTTHTNDGAQNRSTELQRASEVSSPSTVTLRYTLPTWYRHAHVVHLVDFKVKCDRNRDQEDTESGIFVRTHETKMHGDLFMPRPDPESGKYELVRQKYDNLVHLEHFDSESA